MLFYSDTDSTKSPCELLEVLLLLLPLLYCDTDSTTFIQSAHSCRMDKFWRVLVIYIQLPCSCKFKAKAVFYREPTLMRRLSWTSRPFSRKLMHPKRGIT